MYRTAKNATISYDDMLVWKVLRRWERDLKKRHPHHTRQGYDFYMNLGVYCNEFYRN